MGGVNLVVAPIVWELILNEADCVVRLLVRYDEEHIRPPWLILTLSDDEVWFCCPRKKCQEEENYSQK